MAWVLLTRTSFAVVAPACGLRLRASTKNAALSCNTLRQANALAYKANAVVRGDSVASSLPAIITLQRRFVSSVHGHTRFNAPSERGVKARTRQGANEALRLLHPKGKPYKGVGVDDDRYSRSRAGVRNDQRHGVFRGGSATANTRRFHSI